MLCSAHRNSLSLSLSHRQKSIPLPPYSQTAPSMEFAEEVPFSAVLFTAGVCLLLWCAVVKLFSMFISLDDHGDHSGFVSVIDVIKEECFPKQNREGKLRVWRSETQSRVSCVGFDEVQEGESKDETVGLMSTSDYDEICGIELESDDLVGETTGIGVESATGEVGGESREEVRVLGSEDDEENESDEKDGEEKEEEGLFDDWEGIERTELERRFGAAVVFVASQSNAGRVSGVDSETKMRLYGLHKIATEGPCRVPQPMALRVSARAHWNAWQQLGEISQELAMEQYITLLSSSIPGWMGDDESNDKE